MNFTIILAEKAIEIRSLYDQIREMCDGYILPTDDAKTPDIVVEITQEDIDREEKTARAESRKAGEHFNPSPAQLETTAVYRKIANGLLDYNIILMHGSVVSTNEKGYMITAPSGIGKTTRTKLWINNIPNSIVVNGDKPLLKVTDNGIYAFGTPWCGKEGWNTNISIPLHAILLLERSENGNAIRKISFTEAFPNLMKQIYFPTEPDAKRKMLQLIQILSNKVKIYQFTSEPTSKAVLMAWEEIREI